MLGAKTKRLNHNKFIEVRSFPEEDNLTLADSTDLKKRDDADNLQWIFPPGTTDDTSDVAAGFGPAYPEDVIIIEYTPEDQTRQINLYCDWNDGKGAFQIATRNSNGSPLFWHLIETASLKNGQAPAFHFAFPGASAGNDDYWQYMPTSASSSNIWSASTEVGPAASATAAASTAQPASSAAAKSSAAAPTSSTTSVAGQPTSSPNVSSATPRVVTVTAAGGSIVVQTQAAVTFKVQHSGSASGSTSSATLSASGTAIPAKTHKSTTHTTAIAVGVSMFVAFIAGLAMILIFLHKRRKSAENFQAISDTSRPGTKPTGSTPQTLATNGRMGGQGIEMVPREKSQYVEPYVNTMELGADSVHRKAYPAPTPASGYRSEKNFPQVAEIGGQATSPQQAYPAVPPTYAYEMPAQYGQQSGGYKNELA
ncbi:hypothetical protein BU16DRAFT_181323 [Lophium mytilinum]|uniref:Mid2 domain-containing protein n=1 Tax=Lophium mytilinum TaxID=390894 RepID=A0A6A6QBN5_9PEZI|nr:hypothetical protein BU16DRAFT_181323 [Lophium mytilinum]